MSAFLLRFLCAHDFPRRSIVGTAIQQHADLLADVLSHAVIRDAIDVVQPILDLHARARLFMPQTMFRTFQTACWVRADQPAAVLFPFVMVILDDANVIRHMAGLCFQSAPDRVPCSEGTAAMPRFIALLRWPPETTGRRPAAKLAVALRRQRRGRIQQLLTCVDWSATRMHVAS